MFPSFFAVFSLKFQHIDQTTVNRTSLVRLAGSRDKYVIVHFFFGHVTRRGSVMFRESYLHRVFVHTLRSENRILELF